MRNKKLSNSELKNLGKRISAANAVFVIEPQTGPVTNKAIIDLLSGNNSTELTAVGETYLPSSPRGYLEASKTVVQEYFDLITKSANRSSTGEEKFRGLSREGLHNAIELLHYNENLDLSLLNKESSDRIYSLYRKDVLRIQSSFKNLGMPGMVGQSDNKYKHFLRYMVDPFSGVAPGEGVHPHLLNLMRTSFNVSDNAFSIDDFTSGRNRMRSPFSLQRLHERTQKMFPDRVGDDLKGPMNHLAFEKGKTYTVLTWDTETTGLTPESQIREIALVKRTVTYSADGTMTSTVPEILTSKSFSSDLMNIAGYIDKDGNTVPLATAAFESENGKIIRATDKMSRFKEAYKHGGSKAVEDFKEILKIFTNYGNSVENFRIEGHNAEAFDIDKLITTLEGLPAFQEDPEARGLLKKFLQLRTTNPFYTLDTLDSAKLLMSSQQVKLKEILSNETLGLSEELLAGLVDSYSLSPEMFGGKAGTESLENLFLNTNFFELLEQRLIDTKSSGPLLEMLGTRGSHTAEVDTMLNAYMSDFINNNELHIRRLPTAGMPPSGLTDAAADEYKRNSAKLEELFKTHGFMRQDRSMSAFEKFMRARIRRSSSTTPITNISDMSRMSDSVFDFLKTDEGSKKISLSVDADYLARLKENEIDLDIDLGHIDDSKTGKIYYSPGDELSQGKYVFSDFESRGVKGSPGFKTLDSNVVKQAFKFALEESREADAPKIQIGTLIDKSRNEVSVKPLSYNPSVEAISNISITEIQATELDQALKARSLLDTIGRKALPVNNSTALSQALGTTTEFYGKKGGGFNPALVGVKTAEYSQALIERGLPYATYDVRSRIMAAAEAAATSGIGKRLAEHASKFGETGYGELADADLKKLSDIGLQYTMAQGKESIFGVERKTKNRIMSIEPNSYFRTPVADTPAGKRASRIIMTADDLSELVINQFDDKGKVIGDGIKFGSKEFLENKNLNRFVDSTVQQFQELLFEDTINRAFAPKELSVLTRNDLAEQVFSLNVERFFKVDSINRADTAQPMRQEMDSLVKEIFGEINPERRKNLLELAQQKTAEEKENLLRSFANKEKTGDFFVTNYKNSIKTISESIESTFITGMKITGKEMTQTINESRLTQGLAGVNDTDVALQSRVHRLVQTVRAGKDGVIGFIMSGSITDDMDQAARSLSGETLSVGASRAAEDRAALDTLRQAAKVSGTIEEVTPGLNAGEAFAENAIKVGKELYKSNKGKLAIGALALAGAVTGYKMAKRANENDPYDATMALAPVEQGQRPYGIQEALMSNGQTSRRKDPLFTAGVVGNLDRQKIGHTSMGPSKHSHLFGDS